MIIVTKDTKDFTRTETELTQVTSVNCEVVKVVDSDGKEKVEVANSIVTRLFTNDYTEKQIKKYIAEIGEAIAEIKPYEHTIVMSMPRDRFVDYADITIKD